MGGRKRTGETRRQGKRERERDGERRYSETREERKTEGGRGTGRERVRGERDKDKERNRESERVVWNGRATLSFAVVGPSLAASTFYAFAARLLRVCHAFVATIFNLRNPAASDACLTS